MPKLFLENTHGFNKFTSSPHHFHFINNSSKVRDSMKPFSVCSLCFLFTLILLTRSQVPQSLSCALVWKRELVFLPLDESCPCSPAAKKTEADSAEAGPLGEGGGRRRAPVSKNRPLINRTVITLYAYFF